MKFSRNIEPLVLKKKSLLPPEAAPRPEEVYDPVLQLWIISKYLSSLCKLDYVIVLKAGFETQLRTPRLSIPFGMSALGMTRQIGDGPLQGGIIGRYF